jgi:hypothetical protein
MDKLSNIISIIIVLRGQKVIIDADIAKLYDVSTKVLNQAVKRNIDRFPNDFIFQLTQQEKSEVVTNCDHLRELKFSRTLPYAFTEQGVAMLSSVLNSKKSIEVNIAIMRTFVYIRKLIQTNTLISDKIQELEQKTNINSKEIQHIYTLINTLLIKIP